MDMLALELRFNIKKGLDTYGQFNIIALLIDAEHSCMSQLYGISVVSLCQVQKGGNYHNS